MNDLIAALESEEKDGSKMSLHESNGIPDPCRPDGKLSSFAMSFGCSLDGQSDGTS